MNARATWLAAALAWAAAATSAAAEPLLLQISDKAPPCSDIAGLPVVPNDPAAITAGGQRRCYGTQPAIVELRLPEDRLVWLARDTGHPVAWIAVGPTLVDAQGLTPPTLGIRWRTRDDVIVLETRYDGHTTMSPLTVGAWQQVRTAEGAALWVRVPEH